MNHKNERLKKLIERGIIDPEQLARKTGLTLSRVVEGLEWFALTEHAE